MGLLSRGVSLVTSNLVVDIKNTNSWTIKIGSPITYNHAHMKSNLVSSGFISRLVLKGIVTFPVDVVLFIAETRSATDTFNVSSAVDMLDTLQDTDELGVRTSSLRAK